jgi:TM2 domain-containing membrane protein YozV
MEKRKYANLTTKQLQKRKKYATILLVILIAAAMIDGFALIYNLAIGKGFINSLFVSAVACIMIFLPIYMGKKKIEEELKKREEN